LRETLRWLRGAEGGGKCIVFSTHIMQEVERLCDEVVVVAAGRTGLLNGGHISSGAVVIDVGTNVLPDGSLVGDVDEASVRGIAGALTPVPGGVGSVTTSLLLLHTTEAAREQSRALVRETAV
jgi:methylenetetrahydrofolate dehydrogenase (NADP+)/methenyltetrahydrofolate cyclohydrolase